jgi:hypothetical protein
MMEANKDFFINFTHKLAPNPTHTRRANIWAP